LFVVVLVPAFDLSQRFRPVDIHPGATGHTGANEVVISGIVEYELRRVPSDCTILKQ
jgi:hypothetical protein